MRIQCSMNLLATVVHVELPNDNTFRSLQALPYRHSEGQMADELVEIVQNALPEWRLDSTSIIQMDIKLSPLKIF